jgi:hypothetical protein
MQTAPKSAVRTALLALAVVALFLLTAAYPILAAYLGW